MHPILLALIILVGSLLISAVIFYLVSIAPKKLRGLKEKYVGVRFAHRGLFHNGAAENSMTAFKRALEGGYGIELDVSLSKDGVLMVFHDSELSRMTGQTGKVCDYTAEELNKIKLIGSDDTIPTLSEVLSLVNGRVPLLVEIKENETGTAVSEKVCEVMRSYKGDYLIESFNPFALKVVRKNLPEVPRGILSDRFSKDRGLKGTKYLMLEYLIPNLIARPNFIAYGVNGYKNLSLRLCKAMGATTVAWTTHGEKETESALTRFDAVIFEIE